MRIHLVRAALAAAGVLSAAAHAAEPTTAEPQKQSSWNTFWRAARDAIAGAPDARALSERRRFEAAGISFEYPAPLHLTRDADGDPNWTLTYGDFDLDVYAFAQEGTDAGAYLGALESVLGTERANVETPADGESVTWCGRAITPVRMRLTLFGDRHDFRGYDLPAPAGETRFLIFDDVLVNGKRSKTAEVTFAAVAATLRCAAASEPTS
jgi:hypothetical protein